MTSMFKGRDQQVRPHGTTPLTIPAPVGATAVLDQHLRFTGWSREAEELFGLVSEEVLGRSADAVLADAETGAGVSAAGGGAAWSLGPRPVRRGDGRPVSVSLSLTPLALGADATGWLLTAMDAELAHRETVRRALLDGLDREAPVQLVVYDTDARVHWINSAIEKQFGIPLEDAADRFVKDILPQGEVLAEADGTVTTSVEEIVQRVARTGAPVVDVRYRSTTPLDPHRARVWSCSYFRLQDGEGRPIGVCEAALDITDRYVARQRLALLSRASGSIGRTLDIRRTAGELAELAVPEFADAVTVDVFEAVLSGQEPQHFDTRPTLCRVTHRTDHAAAKDTAYDELDTVRLRCLAENTPATDAAARVLALPLKARGATLGVVAFARSRDADPFEQEEIQLAEELVSRTAVCLDNARRYTREHATALTLQRDLLPRTLPQQPGVEVAHRYLPAAGPAGVGGDWYDVIPLSGARVGLVVGDVAGHGTGAAATMGRMRTTVAALAALDLAPDELLARLDDLVARTGAPPSGPAEAEDQALGVTCLYAIYDPVSRHCVMARAGHLPPVLVTPDGHAELVDLPAGPPLGLGGLPFECADIELPEGATLALYTDGLVENRQTDIDAGVRSLCTALARPADGRLDKTCDRVITRLLPQAPEDDAALLLLRVHALAESLVATWDMAPDAGEVARARSLSRDQLAAWGVDEEASFVVELVVSELVTNAIRYGGAPVCLRLIRERGLIVEVSDGGHTSPHLRRAAMEDEGGRGLFLVAQLTRSWGTRYTSRGKTIWTEVPLSPAKLLATFVGGQFEL
ncbi:SpoIIE family protein phosphatase [Streptomyces torulosus]|uniref:SpoIIE family protein phosphatase n=1 Tax=Streptomyces torulosus TaxID=68276 RepID=UPI0006EB7120|nr:SpoIIE family protein phosphatase [Streptomyces torulosus]